MKLVIDTNIFIDHLRQGKTSVFEKLQQQLGSRLQLYVPTVVALELFAGESSKKGKNAQKMEGLFKGIKKIDLSWKIAKRAGELIRDMGVQRDVPDYIVAATALELGLAIVTLNKKHFENIPGLVIYPV